MASKLLIIDDDRRLAQMLQSYLGTSGFESIWAGTGYEGLALMQAQPVDLIILDLMLPDLDGLEVCRRIRQMPQALGHTPVLMLTAKGDPTDRIVGLEVGADDYLPKPFEPRELLARVRAILRRRDHVTTHEPQGSHFTFGTLTIDAETREVKVGGCYAISPHINLIFCWSWPSELVACSHVIKSWRLFVVEKSKHLIDPSMCTWAAFVKPLRPTPKNPGEF